MRPLFLTLAATCALVACEVRPITSDKPTNDASADCAESLKVTVDEFQRRSAKLKSQVKGLERTVAQVKDDRDAWKAKADAALREVARLKPAVPPPVQGRDLADGSLGMARVHSLRTGGCFGVDGVARCLFRELPAESGGGYLIYKTNRRFPAGAGLARAVHDPQGQALAPLTTEVAKVISAFEAANPTHPTLIGAH